MRQKWLTTAEATTVLEVTRRTLNNWANEGKIKKKEQGLGRGKQTLWLVTLP